MSKLDLLEIANELNNQIPETFTIQQQKIKELRDYLIQKQNNICPICYNNIVDPVLDHEHKRKVKGSGKVRFVICRTCNVFLGKIENNCRRYNIGLENLPDVLSNIGYYLKCDQLNIIHYKDREKRKKIKKSSYNKLIKLAIRNNVDIDKYSELQGYPKSGFLTKKLKRFFDLYGLEVEYY